MIEDIQLTEPTEGVIPEDSLEKLAMEDPITEDPTEDLIIENTGPGINDIVILPAEIANDGVIVLPAMVIDNGVVVIPWGGLNG